MTSLATTLLIHSLSEHNTTPPPVMQPRSFKNPKYMRDHPVTIFNTTIHRTDRIPMAFLNDREKINHPPVMPASTTKSEGPFWQSIDNCLESEAEKIVIYCFFIYGMNDHDIFTMYPNKFGNVEQVAEVKRKVLLSIS